MASTEQWLMYSHWLVGKEAFLVLFFLMFGPKASDHVGLKAKHGNFITANQYFTFSAVCKKMYLL